MSSVFVGKVKNVLSADTVVVVPSKSKQLPAPERTFTLSYVRGSGGFQTKEFVRQLLIGKDVKLRVISKHPTTGREFGDIQTPIFDSLMAYLVERGMVKLKEGMQEDSEFGERLERLQSQASLKQQGIWDSEFAKNDKVEEEELDHETEEKSKKTPISSIVEKVISGDRVVLRIILNKKKHVVTPALLAGIRCPRTDEKSQTSLEALVSQQAKAYVEEKLLTAKSMIRVSVLGESQTGVPIVLVYHPSGNSIHEKLLENGYAEVSDWQSSMVGSSTMSALRKAEHSAKAASKGLFSNAEPVVPKGPSQPSTSNIKPGTTIDNVTVTRVISADTLVVNLAGLSEFVTVLLASIRAPRPSDTNLTDNALLQMALVNSAREFVRQKCIGKSGSIFVDGTRQANPDIGLESRPLITFKIHGTTDLSELLVKNGMATVIKHNKATSHERSLNWDRLIELEEEQKNLGKKGVYTKGDISKNLLVGTRIIDASENAAKAKAFFNGFKLKGRISNDYHVEFVPSVNRVKLFSPREGIRLTLILGGLSNSKEDSIPEGHDFFNKKVLQRNVEFQVYDVDRVGGFIANLYFPTNSTLPFQVTLLESGYVSLHEFAVQSNPFSKELRDAEERARGARKGLWKDYDARGIEGNELESTASKVKDMNLRDATPKFLDIEVTEVDENEAINYHLVDEKTTSSFVTFKKLFNDYHNKPVLANATIEDHPRGLSKPPKKNDLVSAKFTQNGKYYRGKVLSHDKNSKLFEVKHIDFGNIDRVPLSSLRALPSKFFLSNWPPFAHSASLQALRLPPLEPIDFLSDTLAALEDYLFDKKLVISLLPSTSSPSGYSGIFYDSDAVLNNKNDSINNRIVADGWAVIDEKSASKYPSFYIENLRYLQDTARSQHLGCWKFGDVEFPDDN